MRERHYVRVAPQVMHDAVLTLYRDDPICPQQLTEAAKPDPTLETVPVAPRLAREQERLIRLEAELGLRAHRGPRSV